jgi:hypothetical protein
MLAHVVGDDVDDHQHVALVRRVDERAQVVEIAEVRVGLGEVLSPVAVVAVDVGVGLDVLDDRGDPQGGDPELLDVVELICSRPFQSPPW